jgi:hypothetical protein
VDYPRNWHELLEWFPDEGSCLRYLERLRWGAGFACRFCGTAGGDWWQMADGLRRCAACRSETSVTAGTIFAGTRTPLVSWFAAIWYVVNEVAVVDVGSRAQANRNARRESGPEG